MIKITPRTNPITPTIPYYHFPLLAPHAAQLAHAVFTRHGGHSEAPFDTLNVRYGIGDPDASVTKNRQTMQTFFEKEFLDGRKTHLISANQTHSDHIFTIHQDEALEKLGEIDDTDAFVTDRRDVSLLIQVADCQPIILYEPQANILGMVHSGWRGSVQNITGKTIAVMRDEFGADPTKIIAAIGPSIGPCCHYFSDPRVELPPEFHQYILPENGSGKPQRVDFLSATRDQLLREGIQLSNIEFGNVCTCDTTGEFFSYRREQLTGRFGVMAALV